MEEISPNQTSNNYSEKRRFLYSQSQPNKRQKLSETLNSENSKNLTGCNSIKNHLDSITETSSNELNDLFLKFMVENDINFEAVNSIFIKKFMEKIRPSYKFPNEEMFRTNVLTASYESTITAVKGNKSKDFTLMIHQSKSTAKAFIKPLFESPILLQELKVVDDFVFFSYHQLAQDVKLKFNGRIVSIVEKCLKEVDIEEFENFHIKCLRKSIETIWERVSDEDLKQEVKNLLRSFNASLQFKSNMTELEMYQNYTKNLTNLKEAAINEYDNVTEMIRTKLYDKFFFEKICRIQKIMEELPKMNTNLYVSDVVKKFVQVFHITSLINENDEIFKKVFTRNNIAAYVFDPVCKEKNLTSNLKSKIRFYVAKLLNDAEEHEKFDEYLERRNEFGREELDKMQPKIYWTMMKGYCGKLSDIALKFVSLPATSECNVNLQQKSILMLSESENQKLSVIKSNLQNISNQKFID